MLDISQAKVEKVIVHHVGNKIREEGYKLSPSEMDGSQSTQELLLRYYLPVFAKMDDRYEFYHESDLSLNATNRFSESVFKGQGNYIEITQNIAKQLYSSSTHPNIAAGEFIVILFSGLIVDEKESSALGLYKTETKDDFFDVEENAGVFQLTGRTGISLQKIQKGALVLEKNNQVLVADTLSQKTKYWIENFLKVTPVTTQKSAAKIAATVLKAVASAIPSPVESISFAQELDAVVNCGDEVFVRDIKTISEKYVAPEKFEEILTEINEGTTSTISDNQILDAKSLNRLTRNVIKKRRIIEGVELQITKSATIKSIEITKTPGGIRAMIDIDTNDEE